MLGIVSNCWQWRLDDGESLDTLIARAVDEGYGAIELRQGSLGQYETGPECRPLPESLARLVDQFPGVQFDLALAYPCFAPDGDGSDELFQAGRAAAVSLAGGGMPHLRLVDPETDATTVDPHQAAETVGRLVAELGRVDGMLSIEHSRQAWTWFRRVFELARDRAGERGGRLKICFDPCNLLVAGDDPAEVTASLSAADISMIHLKQRRNGLHYPAVADGEVDWTAVAAAINLLGFDGPMLFEIAAHENIWEFLDGSCAYLARRGLEDRRPDEIEAGE